MIKIPLNVYKYLQSNREGGEKLKQRLSPFYIVDEADDYAYKNYLLSCLQFQSTRLNITLMMTMGCNFRCIYCFERTSEDIPTSSITVDVPVFCTWLTDLIKKYSIKEVSICFHGGEPMLAVQKIKEISDMVCPFFENNNIFYNFTMVSNGYLIADENLKVILAAKVKIVQITIDGTQEIHDKRRYLANGEGTFSKIIENISKFPPELKVYLNVVYDDQTCPEIVKLFDFLIEKGLQEKISLLILSNVKPARREDEIINESYLQNQIAENFSMLTYEAIERGFHVPSILDPQVCTMKQKNSFVIHPTGKIYKCISGIGDRHFLIGDIYKEADPFDIQYGIFPFTDDVCSNCKYCTICNQGCAYETLLVGHKACQKIFFDKLLPKYIKLLASAEKMNIVFAPEATEWEREYAD